MKWIKPSPVNGSVQAPASKSLTIRATAAALLSKGETAIIGPSLCGDALASFGIAAALGARVERGDGEIRIRGGAIVGENVLDCRESGLSMRLFAPICALREETFTLRGSGSIRTRPMGMIEGPLRELGALCRTDGGYAPVEVRGPLEGGKAEVDGSLGSQLLSGLLMALPLCRRESQLCVRNLKSRPYAAMTVDLLTRFGITVLPDEKFEHVGIPGKQKYKPISLRIEGDWSGAAFLLVAGAAGGRVTVHNLMHRSSQPDRAVLEALDAAGAKITREEESITVGRADLKGFAFDASESPDLFPPLAVLACTAAGKSRVYGVSRLKHKESDRGLALLEELGRIGAKIAIDDDLMVIEGTRLRGGVIDSRGDHRIAMAGAVAGLVSKAGVGIRGWPCVAKSYPDFFEDLRSLGGEVS